MANMQDIITRVRADLDSAEREAASARQRLAVAERSMTELRTFLETFQRYSEANTQAPIAPSSEHAANTALRGLREGTIGRGLVDTCIGAIHDAGHPLTIGQLLSICLAANLTVGGSDQKSNLAGYLSRDPRLRSLGRSVGWDVVEASDDQPSPLDQTSLPDADGAQGRSFKEPPHLHHSEEIADVTGS